MGDPSNGRDCAARTFLELHRGISLAGENDPSELARSLSAGAAKARFRRVSIDEYANQLSLIAAIASFVSSQNDSELIVAEIAKLSGVVQRRNSRPIAIIARALISYGDSEEKAWRTRQFWSRDARVIQNLLDAQVPLDEIAGRLKRDGLTFWARRGNRSTTRTKFPEASSTGCSNTGSADVPFITWPSAAPGRQHLSAGQRVILEYVVTSDASALIFCKGIVHSEDVAADKATAWHLLTEGAVSRFNERRSETSPLDDCQTPFNHASRISSLVGGDDEVR